MSRIDDERCIWIHPERGFTCLRARDEHGVESHAFESPSVCWCCQRRAPNTKQRVGRGNERPPICEACWTDPAIAVANCKHGAAVLA